MATSYRELRKLTIDDLVTRYDQIATNTVVGLDFYRNEIARRDQERQTRTMVRLTWAITWLTAVNVIGVLVALWLSVRSGPGS